MLLGRMWVRIPLTLYKEDQSIMAGLFILEEKNMTFSEALEQLKLGKKLKRKNWNGKNQFIIQIDRDLLENILRGGTDEKWGDRPWKENSFLNSLETTRFNVTDLLAIKTTANQLQLGWLASQTDMLSDDWEVVE